jgi:hypothetical protein
MVPTEPFIILKPRILQFSEGDQHQLLEIYIQVVQYILLVTFGTTKIHMRYIFI